METLKLGSRGPRVEKLQNILSEEGEYVVGSDTVGYFGEATQSAVRKMQFRNTLPITGEVDGKLWVQLNSQDFQASS